MDLERSSKDRLGDWEGWKSGEDSKPYKVSRNTEKSSRDLRRYAVTQTPVPILIGYRWCEKLSKSKNNNNNNNSTAVINNFGNVSADRKKQTETNKKQKNPKNPKNQTN